MVYEVETIKRQALAAFGQLVMGQPVSALRWLGL